MSKGPIIELREAKRLIKLAIPAAEFGETSRHRCDGGPLVFRSQVEKDAVGSEEVRELHARSSSAAEVRVSNVPRCWQEAVWKRHHRNRANGKDEKVCSIRYGPEINGLDALSTGTVSRLSHRLSSSSRDSVYGILLKHPQEWTLEGPRQHRLVEPDPSSTPRSPRSLEPDLGVRRRLRHVGSRQPAFRG